MTVLDRARAGDEQAFRELVAPYSPELRAGLSAVTVAGDRVDTVTRFHDPRVLGHAGLPPRTTPA